MAAIGESMAENTKKRPQNVSVVQSAKKKVRRSAEGIKSKKESDRRRRQTRITIGEAFPRWRALKKEKGLRSDIDVALLLLDSYENMSKFLTSTGRCIQEPSAPASLGSILFSESFEEMEVTIDEDECNSDKNKLSDWDSDREHDVETTELSAPEAEDRGDEEHIYVPILQSSTASELLLECEEEELEPWQKPNLKMSVKEEDNVVDLSKDQTHYKPEPSLLQINAVSISHAHDGEVDQINNVPVSSSSIQSPAVHASSPKQLQSDQSISQTLSAPLSQPCITVYELESAGTSNTR